MILDPATCQQARLSRDPRFDGKFYTAVLTTGIYCRPTCPAGPAKEENVRYYQNAVQAEFYGYQPCKRCKPELSPNMPLPTLLEQAVEILSIQPTISVNDLATKLDISERQLQRYFEQHLGMLPKAFINQKRQINARNLLLTTTLSMPHIASISGFTSLRSFNDNIKAQYKQTPSQIRAGSKRSKSDYLSVKLRYSQDLDFALMLSFFRARLIPGVEHIEDTYQRTIELDGCSGWIEVSCPAKFNQVKDSNAKNNSDSNNAAAQNSLLNREQFLQLDLHLDQYTALPKIIARVRKMFDLDCELDVITNTIGTHDKIKQAITAFPGLRLPGCWHHFEFSIRAILGQQISVKAATTLASRIATRYGKPPCNKDIEYPQQLTLVFPSVSALSDAEFDNLGITNTRMQTLKTWVEFYASNESLFDNAIDSEVFEQQLCQLKGIGPWTANYLAMRGLSLPDAFPAADLGIIKALSTEQQKVTPKQILNIAEQWRPWRAYAAIYLWHSLSLSNE